MYSVDQIVNFKRNASIKENNCKIVHVFNKKTEKEKQSYIIEFSEGWFPNQIRIESFGLNPEKKYLNVFEKELSVIE